MTGMMQRLISVSEALEPILQRIGPVAPTNVPGAEALGAVLAADVTAPHALPQKPVALRKGYAVSALDLVGASPHSPVTPGAMPKLVEPGMTLPPGCDAILPVEALSRSGALIEITRSVSPGEYTRLAGHDLPAGRVIATGGTILTPTLQWIFHLAGVECIDIRRPRIGLDISTAADRAWLAAMLAAMGCEAVGCEVAETHPGSGLHLVLTSSSETMPRLALGTGETATIAIEPGSPPTIRLPQRFDGRVAAFFALVLPVLETLTGARAPRLGQPLTRKLTSAIGITEIALLKTVETGYLPLGAGEITLASLIAADAVAILGPESEGLAQGSIVSAIALDLEPRTASNTVQNPP